MKMLSTMLMMATVGHHGQFDKSGKPYILHPLKVMHYLKSDDEELQCIALGHDILEDTEITEEDLLEAGMTLRVVRGIKSLTKIEGESYELYKEKVKSNIDAILVKMADLRHNSDIRRLKGDAEQKDIDRINRYRKFYKELQDTLARVPHWAVSLDMDDE